MISDYEKLILPEKLLNLNLIYINLNNYIDNDILNEKNSYFKIIKSYKCIFDLILELEYINLKLNKIIKINKLRKRTK